MKSCHHITGLTSVINLLIFNFGTYLIASIPLKSLKLQSLFFDTIAKMPPKNDATNVETTNLLKGFTNKETKLLAAAFLSSIGPDKVSFRPLIARLPAIIACYVPGHGRPMLSIPGTPCPYSLGGFG